MPNAIPNDLLSSALLAAGFTDNQIEQMLKDFQIVMNADILEDVLFFTFLDSWEKT